MTVNELIEWLESAKRQSEQSGQTIDNYEVVIDGAEIDPHVDHGRDAVYL